MSSAHNPAVNSRIPLADYAGTMKIEKSFLWISLPEQRFDTI
jgi:hypothetical protein